MVRDLEFTYSEFCQPGARRTTHYSQLSEAIQFFVDRGCCLRTFCLDIQLDKDFDVFERQDSGGSIWRNKLLGGIAIMDALSALQVSGTIEIGLSDHRAQEEGFELVTKMVEAVAARKGWQSTGERDLADYGHWRTSRWTLLPCEV